MCCFSGQVTRVESTKIFARPAAGERQILVYEMSVQASSQVAMILPIPTPPRSPDDAVRFVSVELYKEFFDDVDRAFPPPPAMRGAPQSALFGLLSGAPPLRVHTVGAFVASFVPTLADFSRLDPRFRMPAGTLDRVPDYADWGFAVFQLATPTNALARLHPMAFEFPTRRPDLLFFPTVHVHDGALHPEALFAHRLYGQHLAPAHGWTASDMPLARVIKPQLAAGVVDLDATVSRMPLDGRHPNRDVWATVG